MKKYFLIIPVLFMVLLTACNSNDAPATEPAKVIIKPRTIEVTTLETDFTINKNEEYILAFKVENPRKLDIISVVINGELYSNFQFADGSTYEEIRIPMNSGATPGPQKFTLTSMKVINGLEVQNLQVKTNNEINLFVNYEAPTINEIKLDKEQYFKNQEAIVTVLLNNPDNTEIQYLRVNGVTYDTFEEGSTNSTIIIKYVFDGEYGDKRIFVSHAIYNGIEVEFTENNTINTFVVKDNPTIEDINVEGNIGTNRNIILKIDLNNPDATEITSVKINGELYTQFEENSNENTVYIKYNLGDTPGLKTIKITEIVYSNGQTEMIYMIPNNTINIYVEESNSNIEVTTE